MTEKSLTIRENGDLLPAEKTRAVWAASGTGTSPEANRALAMIGDHYDLDPALGEIVLLGGKVYITAEGYQRIADSHPQYDGMELRPMAEDERKSMKVGDEEQAFVCFVHRKDRSFPSVGYGIASARNIAMGSMKVFERELAQKRAMHRALRGAFRAGYADYDEAMGAIEDAQIVTVEERPQIDAPPKGIAPDWAKFWLHTKGAGASPEEVHQALGVDSVKEWQGSLEEAITVVERYILTGDTEAAPSETFEQAFPRDTVPAEPEPTGGNGKPAKAAAERAPPVSGERPATIPTTDGLGVTAAQIRAIYSIGNAINLTEEVIDEQAFTIYGVKPAELSKVQASAFIKSLQAK